jgi:NitT/TauT family transport system ATP-binding protein/nitrate/nitrite transport system substrate-binding protein
MKIPFNIEKPELKIGFIPLTDCAPLVVAKEMGFFKKWGLNVKLEKQHSWATLRDKVHAGLLDAAQMLAPMPLASTLGLGCAKANVITPLVLSQNGNAITIAEHLYRKLLQQYQVKELTLPLSSSVLHKEVAYRKSIGQKLSFATVFPYSCHYYQLVSWFERGNIDLADIDIVIISPENMVSALQSGDIDGCCVGGPWNARAVREMAGLTCVTASDIWEASPEKVLGLLAQWQIKHPETTMALVAALQDACRWLDSIPYRFEAARILSRSEYLGTDIDNIAPSLLGSCLTYHDRPPRVIPSYNLFSSVDEAQEHSLNLEYGNWLLDKMVSCGHVNKAEAENVFVGSVFRFDIYQAVNDIVEPHFDPFVSLTLTENICTKKVDSVQ